MIDGHYDDCDCTECLLHRALERVTRERDDARLLLEQRVKALDLDINIAEEVAAERVTRERDEARAGLAELRLQYERDGAELSAVRDENARLREACEDSAAWIDDYCRRHADDGARAQLADLRAALTGSEPKGGG